MDDTNEMITESDDFYWNTLNLADELYEQGKHEEALKLYKEIAGEDDLSGDANAHLFQLLLDTEKYEEALEYYGYVLLCCDTSPREGAYIRMAKELRNPESKLFMYFDEESFYYDCLGFIYEDDICLYDFDDEDDNSSNEETGELYLKKNIETILLTRAKSEDEEIKKSAMEDLLWLYLDGCFRVGDLSFESLSGKNIEKTIEASILFAEFPDIIDELYCDFNYFTDVIYNIYENYKNNANEYVKRFVTATLKHAERLGNIEVVFDKVESELSNWYEGWDHFPFYLGFIPNGINRVPTFSFSGGEDGNYELESIAIPDTITTISDKAFWACHSLTSISIPASVTSIGKEAFFDCDKLTSITVDENNKKYKSIDGNLYSKDGKELIKYASGKADNEFVVPNCVTNICGDAIDPFPNLTSVVIPTSVTSIDICAIYDNCCDFVVKGYEGSCAERYAKNSDLPFEKIIKQ